MINPPNGQGIYTHHLGFQAVGFHQKGKGEKQRCTQQQGKTGTEPPRKPRMALGSLNLSASGVFLLAFC